MSASREKKQRQTPGELTERERRQLTEERKAHRNRVVYIAIGVVITVLAIVLLVWDSKFFQSRDTAVTVNDVAYTAADLQYFYGTVYKNETENAPTEGEGAFDPELDPAEQVKDAETEQTWGDYLIDQTIDQFKRYAVLEQQAKADGYVLSEEGKEYKKTTLTDVDSAWRSAGFPSRAAFVRAQYGPYMSEKKFLSLLDRDVLVAYYVQDKQKDLTYTDEEYEEHYETSGLSLNTYVYDQFTFRVSLSEEETAGRTDEEKAALLETAKTQMKAKAQDFKDRLDAGEDAAALAKEYEDSLYSTLLDEKRIGSSVNSSLSVWLYTDSRVAGDTTLTEYDSGEDSFTYYVARFSKSYRDETPTANVRHVLVSAGEAPTEEEYAKAKIEAEKLLADWQAGDATEDSFAELARKHSADTGSAVKGGLIEGVSSDSGYVDTFTDWAMDSDRKAGDTGIVKNTGSSIKGWHIMYFVGEGDPAWKLSAAEAMSAEEMNDWLTEQEEAATIVKGEAIQYLSYNG